MKIKFSFTKTEQKIIKFLSDYPAKEFFSQEIANYFKISKGGSSQTLRKLTDKKLLLLRKRGNMKFYQINTDNPIVSQYKINLVINQINFLIEKLKKISKEIILFGSTSRGEQTADSDIDLFILTNNKRQVKEILNKQRIKPSIKAVIKTSTEWSETEIKEPEFYNEVKRGIKLYHYVPTF